MSTRRSLCAFGVLLLALVLLAPGLAVAQDTTPAIEVPPVPTNVTATNEMKEFDEVEVAWGTITPTMDTGPFTAFNIYYSTRMFDDSQNAKGPVVVTEDQDAAKTKGTLKGLDANTVYYVRVAVVNDFKIGPLDEMNPQASAKTAVAPKPERVTDVRTVP